MRFWIAVVVAMLLAAPAVAQKSGGPPQGTPTTGGSNGRSTPSSTTSPFPDTNGIGPRPIYLSGKVILSDGTPLPDRARIERVCNGAPRLEGYTDRKGRFSIEIGHSLEMPDASSANGIPDSLSGNPGMRGNTRQGQLGGDRSLFGCELRASLTGYRSDEFSLSTVQYMDNPEIGTLILHPLAKVDGLTISVTSALAPKDARKAYEKGRDALLKKNPDEAQKNFEKAVEIYPKYSSAWYDLGQLNEQRDHFEEARKDYQQAIVAEPKFLQPYARLSWLWLRDTKWQELADETDRWLKLDPSNTSEAYYLSSIANLQLQHFDIAEKNAREAIKLDPAGKNVRAHYVLGLALAQQHKFADSAESLRAFLAASPQATDAPLVRQQLSQVEAAAKESLVAPPPQ
jgi:tetratricopeptide (TPR) repeat protein